MSETVPVLPELVQTYRFQVRLTRSAPGPTLVAPPDLALAKRFRFQERNKRVPPRRPAAPPPPADPGRRPKKDDLGDGAFQECSGLDLEAEPKDYTEGGRNDGLIRRVGRVKLVPIVLKRGMFIASAGGYADTELWEWLQGMVEGSLPLLRYDGHVEVYNSDRNRPRIVAQWSFDRGLPSKVSGASLNAKTGDIAIEELHILHEGLRLESKVGQ